MSKPAQGRSLHQAIPDPIAEIRTLRKELDRSRSQYESDVKALRKQLLDQQALPLQRDGTTVADNLVAQHEIEALHRALREREETVEELTTQVRDLEDKIEDRYQTLDQLRQEVTERQRAQEQAEQRALEAEHQLAAGAASPVPADAPQPGEPPATPGRPVAPPPAAPPQAQPAASTAKRPQRPVGAFLLGLVVSAAVAFALWATNSMPPAQTVYAPLRSLAAQLLRSDRDDPGQASPDYQPTRSPPLDAPEAPVAPLDPAAAVAPQPPPPTRGIVRDPNGPAMVWINPAEFRMGYGRGLATADHLPAHDVQLDAYLIGATEVSIADYDRYVAATGARSPSDFGRGRGDQPVVDVSWDEAVAYARWLARRTGKPYRLPSEAEWEYAARADSIGRFWWGSGAANGRAVCLGCGSDWDNRSPAPVASFPANPFGLHHIVGNVEEWVGDCYRPSYKGAPADGRTWDAADCEARVTRGGAYNRPDSAAYSHARTQHPPASRMPSLGFRVARDAD